MNFQNQFEITQYTKLKHAWSAVSTAQKQLLAVNVI